MKKFHLLSLALCALIIGTLPAHAGNQCDNLPSYKDLQDALKKARAEDNGGLNLDMWATVVNRAGVVCAVTYTGATVDAQWPGSRVISAQKANTANAFSLKGLALSTANLYSAVQPGGSLFGLQESNPVNVKAAYAGSPEKFGSDKDPLVGEMIGGVNVFGGGLALYNDKGDIVGAVGVSGDTSCADHNIAWRVRDTLKLNFVPAGVSPEKNDNIIYDITGGKSAGGFGHPSCGGKEMAVFKMLPTTKTVTAAPEVPAVKK
jgi:uncharacterized protein GlcG (DUF336 family)